MSDRRIRITGIGVVTPLGADRESSWRRIAEGDKALRWLTADELSVSRAAWPAESAGAPALMAKDLPKRCAELTGDRDVLPSLSEPVIAQALAATDEAIRDADLDLSVADRDRIGCVIGTSKGAMGSAESLAWSMRHGGAPEIPWRCMWPSGAAAMVAATWRLGGPLLCPVTACATGLSSLVRGVELIRDDVCDIVIAGSSDASLTPAMLASFKRLGVLAKGFSLPATAVRPFDRDRSGFLIGEGAGVFVLEAEQHALARGRRGYAEWLSGSGLGDATGLTQLAREPAALVRLIEDNLRRADLSPRDVDYVNLHGTATEPNDFVEAHALQRAFGSAASSLRCSSLKGAIGHLLGAAGSVEFAATLLALRDGRLPPTANLTTPDAGFDLDFITGAARHCDARVAMKLSLGFGGHLVASIVRRVDP